LPYLIKGTLTTLNLEKSVKIGFHIFRENITSDILQGCAVVTLTLLAFMGLVSIIWLKRQTRNETELGAPKY